MAGGPITERIKKANLRAVGEGDEAVVRRVNALTDRELNWKSAKDVEIARDIENTRKASREGTRDEGKPPVA